MQNKRFGVDTEQQVSIMRFLLNRIQSNLPEQAEANVDGLMEHAKQATSELLPPGNESARWLSLLHHSIADAMRYESTLPTSQIGQVLMMQCNAVIVAMKKYLKSEPAAIASTSAKQLQSLFGDYAHERKALMSVPPGMTLLLGKNLRKLVHEQVPPVLAQYLSDSTCLVIEASTHVEESEQGVTTTHVFGHDCLVETLHSSLGQSLFLLINCSSDRHPLSLVIAQSGRLEDAGHTPCIRFFDPAMLPDSTQVISLLSGEKNICAYFSMLHGVLEHNVRSLIFEIKLPR